MSIIKVTIKEIRKETPTVRVIKLDLQGQKFDYKPGQWIDCYAEINNVKEIAGYSIASTPSSTNFIELAIKISDNPVTRYIHEKAVPNDTLYIEGGQGNIYYEKVMSDKVVLIAAGIGIAPLMGILRYIYESTSTDVHLFQSASTFEELIYYSEIISLAESNPRIKYNPSVTSKESPKGVNQGRITGDMIDKYNVDLDSLFFISGPGKMIPDLKYYLMGRGVDEQRIKYEVWW